MKGGGGPGNDALLSGLAIAPVQLSMSNRHPLKSRLQTFQGTIQALVAECLSHEPIRVPII